MKANTIDPATTAAYSRVLNSSGKLVEALADLTRVGGLSRLRGKMKPSSVDRAADSLRAARSLIDAQLVGLERPAPTRPLLRRQSNAH